MSVSADETGIYIVEEATYGVVPTNPAFVELPIVSESLGTNANTTTSNTLNPDRQLVDNILTGLDVSGNLEIEVARTAALDLIMESAFASDFDISGAPAWALNVGTTKKSFTIMKRWPDPAGTPGVDYLYHIYQGCVVNSMTINMPSGAEVTSSIAMIGKEVDADTTTVLPVGATLTSPSAFNVLRAPEVQDIVLDNVANTLATAIGAACVTDLTLTLNANVRGIQCLGTLGNKETVLGRFESTLAMTIFFNSNDIMEEFLNQGIVDASFTIGDDTTADHYAFTVPKGKISAETVVAGGTGTDVVNAVTVQALIDNTLTPPTSLKLDTSVLALMPLFLTAQTCMWSFFSVGPVTDAMQFIGGVATTVI